MILTFNWELDGTFVMLILLKPLFVLSEFAGAIGPIVLIVFVPVYCTDDSDV